MKRPRSLRRIRLVCRLLGLKLAMLRERSAR